MTVCAIHDPGSDGRCCWCRHPAEAHEWRWCSSCNGDRSIPDLTDRASYRQSLPIWAWRHVPCGCRLEGQYVVRRGGIIDREGRPVEDELLDAAGVN